ncbi:MAG: hypothetical protein D6806_04635 [Deltaproteobacteria bacterium]|nr:MAG: hypothetical protein D6806_04635 [Deltaproteobacteria bacterium]
MKRDLYGVSRGKLAATLMALALASCFLAACSARGTESLEEPIINGSPDTSTEHQAVVFLLVISSSGAWSCSGTLITPTAVLTAGHCTVAQNGRVVKPQDVTVYFGNAVGSMTDRAVAGVYPHPQYEPIVPVPNDIALLVLAEPAPDWVTPIPPLPPQLGLTEADVGAEIEYVGFGLDENGNSGRKLHVNGTIDVICGAQGGCPASMVPNSFCADMRQGGTCSGDSGGPAFIKRNGTEYVCGVTSYGDWNCSYYGCSTKVDGHWQFIQDVVGTDKPNGSICVSDAQCRSGFCRDGYCCESECAEPCMACDIPKQEGKCLPAPDGHPCTDGDPCNGTEICLSQVCTNQNDPPDCSTADPCVQGSCEQGTGCVYVPVQDGTACDNNDACDGPDTCQGGICTSSGEPLNCDDGNPCTSDECNPATGCFHRSVEDGTSCSDGDACNGQEVCQAGQCVSSEPLDCDDANACTEDTCDPAVGCSHTELPEGSNCGEGRTCQQGLCLPAPSGGCGCSSNGTADGGLMLFTLIGLLLATRKK